MKVNFSIAGIPVKSFTNNNVSNSFANFKLANQPLQRDVFVKSTPAFKGDIDKDIRPEVVESSIDGIASNLAIYANVSAHAMGHKMPLKPDFDYCMENFFLLCCAASSSHAVSKGDVRYPNEPEFIEILQALWDNSRGLEGANEQEYLTDSILDLPEQKRKYHIKDFVKDDIARAMNVYAQNRYGIELNDRDDVAEFASRVYNDESTRTIKESVSHAAVRKAQKGKLSKHVNELADFPDSKSMIEHMFANKKRYFSSPMSLRERFIITKPVEDEPFFTDGDPYEDHRTPAEKAVDQMNGWPW